MNVNNIVKFHSCHTLGMVMAMDEGIGEIVKTMKANSLYDDTVFMLISRNGGSTDQGGSSWPLR